MTQAHRDFRLGVLAMLPVLAAMVPFALVLGALGVQKGLSPLEIVLMGALVFAGSAQFLAVELWSPQVSIGLLLSMTLLVNSRHILMGAALAPVLPYAGWKTWAGLHVMADEIWAMTLGRQDGPPSWPYYAGLAVPLYLNWLFWTGTGALLGSVVDDPAAYGFDFAFAAIFIVLIKGMVRSWRGHAVWIVSGLVSALTFLLVPGPAYVPIGALAGCITAYMMRRA